LRIGPFEGPANVKPPVLPEVDDFSFLCEIWWFLFFR